ncbi:class III poly(R)-hydroxyalkanoic acid synthase subunit PhaC [Natranaerofaba carboxydovora]|uniref:class III poly(R)-hydroxyalkanoic acid synthase subunit PhaC n=1 Tax=Natranaerofaba carboxydovora TaxID=2742683 RepID=UPI001F145C9B|nr:class III poly(R)-hydroxyalkanoic acid synthase subunit PhaC [Natranaerofaba carboxydovora]UMZ72577.1 Poly(3-hydroxyalkanoate) polymerase subunit PhaC [Natranaerofaba carboxydovora]
MFFPIDYKKSMEELVDLNKKMIKGTDIMLSLEKKDVDVAPTPKELIYQEDKMKLYHYKPIKKDVNTIPTVIVYALVNRQYMMDLQEKNSVIKRWLELGLDVYIVDWGYPDKSDKYITMEDYIYGYMDNAINKVMEINNVDEINLLGVCQGGTFSAIYSALFPEKIKNLVTMVAPFDFDTKDGLLFHWSDYMDVDNLVDAHGVIPADFMNFGFLMLRPFSLTMDKYVGFLDNADNPEVVKDFLRMERWIFDSPDQAGEAFRKFIKELYQENKLIKNELQLGGRTVDLKNIDMPLLNVYAEKDHLVPPAASKPLNDVVSSKDKELVSIKGGHIGIYVGSKSQKEVAPKVADWLNERSTKKTTKKSSSSASSSGSSSKAKSTSSKSTSSKSSSSSSKSTSTNSSTSKTSSGSKSSSSKKGSEEEK